MDQNGWYDMLRYASRHQESMSSSCSLVNQEVAAATARSASLPTLRTGGLDKLVDPWFGKKYKALSRLQSLFKMNDSLACNFRSSVSKSPKACHSCGVLTLVNGWNWMRSLQINSPRWGAMGSARIFALPPALQVHLVHILQCFIEFGSIEPWHITSSLGPVWYNAIHP